jgi:hypothetical protein
MKLMIDYHEEHSDCFRKCVSSVIEGDWNEIRLPRVPVSGMLLVWFCAWLHFTGLSENVGVFCDTCTAGPYDSCFDRQQIDNHRVIHLVPEVAH